MIGQRIREILTNLFLDKGGTAAPKPVIIKSGKMTYRKFVETYYPFAKQIENDSGVPAVFILAQASIESDWNRSKRGNNLFGITARASEKNKILLLTYEILDKRGYKFPVVIWVRKINENQYRYKVKRYFRTYDTPADCFRDHLKVLRKPWFASAWKYLDDPYKFAEGIARGNGKLKYASAPNYESILKQRMKLIEPYIKAIK